MCVSLTPVLFFLTTLIIEICVRCFAEWITLRDIGKPTSRAEINCSPSSLYLKALKGTHNGSALVQTQRFTDFDGISRILSNFRRGKDRFSLFFFFRLRAASVLRLCLFTDLN